MVKLTKTEKEKKRGEIPAFSLATILKMCTKRLIRAAIRSQSMTDMSHLIALEQRLSNEQAYLAKAKTENERELRKVWIAQIEKEIASEKKFLGIEELPDDIKNMSDDDLLNELLS